jgi:two-component system, OmpR family, phosphate regulon response regulator PhoB
MTRPKSRDCRLLARLLVVDSSAEDRTAISRQLRAAGHEAVCAADASTAIAALERSRFDAVIAEWHMGGAAALDLAERLRRDPLGAPRILVSSRTSEPAEIARALDSGVDDFLVMSAPSEELVARINAALRRPAAVGEAVIQVGPVVLNRSSHRVTINGLPIGLAPGEFRLMAYFLEHPGRVLGRRQLLGDVWHRSKGIGPRTVDVHVRRLRAALAPHGCDHLLQTVRGFGYRFG